MIDYEKVDPDLAANSSPRSGIQAYEVGRRTQPRMNMLLIDDLTRQHTTYTVRGLVGVIVDHSVLCGG